jgi:hypothetical protein
MAIFNSKLLNYQKVQLLGIFKSKKLDEYPMEESPKIWPSVRLERPQFLTQTYSAVSLNYSYTV